MILTRSTRLSQPQGPVEVAPEWGGRGAVYLPPVQSNINRVAGTVGRGPTPQGSSASYTAGAETKIERLNGSAPNGITEFTQLVYLTPIAGGVVNDRGIFGNWNTTGATSFVQLVHRARDAITNGRYCYVVSYDPTSGATAAGIRTSDYSAVDNVPALLVATVKNNTLSLYLNGVLHSSTAVSAVAMSGQAELQIGNYYDNTAGRRLSANVHMAAFLPRGLGGSEVAALSRNPWQLFRPVQRRVYFDMGAGGGATTSVNADLGADYTIRSTVQSDGSGAYAIRAEVAADASSGYGIRGVVSADAAVSYVVRAPAQADAASTFTVRGAAQADAASTFTVRGFAQADAASTFTVRGGAASDATAAYLLRGAASSDLSASYDIQTASGVSSSVSASYVVRGAAQSDAAAAYDLRKSVGANSEHAFMVRGLVSSDLGSAYIVQAALMPVYADISASYSIAGAQTILTAADFAAIRAHFADELAQFRYIQTKVDAAL